MKLLTVPEAAAMLSVKPQWLYKMAKAGAIPSLRLGRQVRIDEEALGEWLRSQAAGGRNGDASSLRHQGGERLSPDHAAHPA